MDRSFVPYDIGKRLRGNDHSRRVNVELRWDLPEPRDDLV